MTRPTVWTHDQIEYLFILREVLNYNYPLCAQLMTREYKRPYSKNAVMSLHKRQQGKCFTLAPEVITEVKEAAGLP